MAKTSTDAAMPANGQVVTGDLPCVRCGYNLRTLAVGGRCTECGADVAVTLELGAELERARPAYIRRLAIGCWMLVAARAGLTLFTLLCAIAGNIGWLIYARRYYLEEVLPVLAIACILYGVGSLLLTTREHPRLPPELPRSKLALQICSVGVLTGGVLILVGYLPFGGGTPTGIVAMARDLGPQILFVTTAIYCLCPTSEIRVLVRLSRRVGDAHLHEHAIIAGVGATISGLVGLMVLSSRPNISLNAGLCTLLATLVAVLLFWIWTGYVSYLAASHLTHSWHAAKTRWEERAFDHG